MIDRKHGIYGISLGSTVLGGITRQDIATGSDVRGEATSGEVWAAIQALYAQQVSPSFATMAVGTALGLLGASGASIGTLGGMTLYAQKHQPEGGRASSGHRSFGFASGIVAPKTLSVNHRGDATLTVDAVISYDGQNAPVVVTDGATLPSGSADAERYTLGPASIGGVSLGELKSFQVDFGLDILAESADSEIWATFVSIRQQQTVLTLGGIDVEWLKAANIPLLGKLATHANTKVFLRRRAPGGTFVENNQAYHVKFTACGFAVVEDAFRGSARDAGEVTVRMPLAYDGSNAPLLIVAGSAIS
jgi:hypothetical protein